MNWDRIRAIIRKDLQELRMNRMAVIPMLVVPVILCVALPAVLTGVALELDVSAINGAAFIEKLLPVYEIPAELNGLSVKTLYVFLNYMFVPFFMLVPVMVSSIIAANSVVGEKERHTLETLLYTPVTNEELIMAKQLASFLPAFAISVVSFVAFFVVTNTVSLVLAGIWMVRSPLWIPAILLVSPAASLLALAATLMISLRAKSFMEAQQMAAVVIIPFLLLMVGQFSGLLILSLLHVVGFGVGLLAVDLLLLRLITPRFERETILKTL